MYEHLIGAREDASDVIGLYPMFPDETINFLVFDFDCHDDKIGGDDGANLDSEWMSLNNVLSLETGINTGFLNGLVALWLQKVIKSKKIAGINVKLHNHVPVTVKQKRAAFLYGRAAFYVQLKYIINCTEPFVS